MTDERKMRGVLFFSDREPQITGYLVIGNEHFEIGGWHTSKIRADLQIKKTGETRKEPELFDEGSASGAAQCDQP